MEDNEMTEEISFLESGETLIGKTKKNIGSRRRTVLLMAGVMAAAAATAAASVYAMNHGVSLFGTVCTIIGAALLFTAALIVDISVLINKTYFLTDRRIGIMRAKKVQDLSIERIEDILLYYSPDNECSQIVAKYSENGEKKTMVFENPVNGIDFYNNIQAQRTKKE